MRERTTSALLIHGAGGGGWEWNVWRAMFEAAGLATVAPDLRPAPAGIAATRLHDYRAQMQAALLALPRPRAVIGASLGGLVALGLAGDADACVAVNPIPPAPWHTGLAARLWPDIVPWGREARLDGTRRAIPDADAASALFAFRRWRDESGAVLREAYAGVRIDSLPSRLLCVVSDRDADVPPEAADAFAQAVQADVLRLPGASHVGPLLGCGAAKAAGQVLAWLSAR